jgi:hypothetical protein
MAYVIKDEVSGKYLNSKKELTASVADAAKYDSMETANSAAARFQRIYDNWEANDQAAKSRGYSNALKPINPKPFWAVKSV